MNNGFYDENIRFYSTYNHYKIIMLLLYGCIMIDKTFNCKIILEQPIKIILFKLYIIVL